MTYCRFYDTMLLVNYKKRELTLITNYRIAAYTRISVDTELDKDNTSIENQKAIIEDYCKINFPTSTVDYFEDRDHSGYTFEQRPDYWIRLRPKLLRGEYDILIVKDLSRFSRRTGKGLAEFEDLAEHDIRIIAIGDGVDYYQDHIDDWMKIKLYFFVNEMPVTDASRKVSDVIASRQAKGEWICSVPYGYVITNSKKMIFEVDEAAAEVVRTIFKLYIDGYGYKRIANYLTDQSIPTPRMREKARKEAAGDEYKGKVKEQWSIVTVSEILCNDFYIGTLRERKFRRKKINGVDVELDKSEHIVFENHHEPIVDYRVFATAQEMLKQRSTNHYRGVKKYDNTYSGFMFCGDCGSPMFAMSRKDLAEAYTCGTYHVRGLAGCTSHHVRADFLDKMLKQYVKRVRDNSAAMLRILEEMLSHEQRATDSGMIAADELREQIEAEREELKLLARQKIRDMAKVLKTQIMAGSTFADPLARYPKVFGYICIGLVKAGEEAGELEKTLGRIKDLLSKQAAIKGKVIGTLMYPCFVIVLAFLIVLVMLIFVFPAFKDMFAQQDKSLPIITKVMIEAGDYLKEFWYTIPLFIIAFVVFVMVLFKWKPARELMDKLVLKIPLFNNLILFSNYSNFLSVISVSYDAGIPIVDCLHLGVITLTNSVMKNKMSGAIVKVQQGMQVSQAFKSTKIMPKMLLFMVSTGEQSGRLGDMLEKAVNYLDKTLDGVIDTMTKMIEPIMLLVIGGIVLVLALALYLPLFQSYMS